ncbi:MAG: A/G-specific adenine glycosylase [Acidobacteria bacterium]|nr:A/G-specific adenine glycosylase [Acidobacteriota bacterium]
MLKLPIPVKELASRLLKWYRENRRELPWRTDSDPYRVWVSEIMLQQTQVKTVVPYFEEFLRTYPNIEALADAQENEILSAWSGLGYYKRARNLHKTAQILCEQHGGEFPRDFSQVLQLPGIGPYTAGAILSLAYGEPVPILDGNISRLFSRYLKIEGVLEGSTLAQLQKFLVQLVSEASVSENIRDFNQALMEMGALVCTPRNPQCVSCPLAASCLAYQKGLEKTLPRPRTRRAVQEFHYTVALIARGEKYLLTQNWEDTFLRGFWEFPRIQGPPTPRLAEKFKKTHGLHLKVREKTAPVAHRITFRKLNFHPVLVSLQSPAPHQKFTWTRPGQKGYPVSSYIKKILNSLES